MKKPIHLYIFVVLSAIATFFRLQSSFLTSFDEEQFRATFNGVEIEGLDQLIEFTKVTTQFSSNLVNKLLALVLLVLLVVTIFFLFKKKNETASYTYLGYLFGTLVSATYAYVGLTQLTRQFEGGLLTGAASAGGLGGYLLNVLLFAIYFGLTVFFLLKKPKVGPDMGQTATDL